MKMKRVLVGVAVILVAGAAAAAYIATPTVHTGQTGEAPELGRPGSFRLGTTVAQFMLKDRTRISGASAVTGNLESVDRSLAVRFWYPAVVASGAQPVRYEHVMQFPGKPPLEVDSQGRAVADATPLTGNKYPLVLMSHGYGGWSTQFSNLAEHIASHGYVVASIDHQDLPVEGIKSALLSFGNVLVDRTLDQRQILTQILADVRGKKAPYLELVDTQNIALIGYSMGGYGAIASAGAPYSFDANPMSSLPEAAQIQLRAATAQTAPIKALVTFAPWGGQPDNRAWAAQAIAKITVPVLLVAGNQDDVVNFKEGVSWLYRNMTGTERYMLVFREARHNIIGNEFKLDADERFAGYEFLKEPVWRSDRLNAINQHFVTAFLDLTLKGDTQKRAYLNVPTVDSNAGEWPTSFAEQLNGTTAGPKQDKYWRGFQRRWATGLEMHHAAVGKAEE